MPTADIVVIGAGATGCAVAAHLLRLDPKLQVVLLDRAHVGTGSTSRSTAAFRHQWSVPAHVSFSRYSAAEYDRQAEEGFPVQFRRQPVNCGFYLLPGDKDMRLNPVIHYQPDYSPCHKSCPTNNHIYSCCAGEI